MLQLAPERTVEVLMLVTRTEKDHFAVQVKGISNITSQSPGGSASAACTSHHFVFPASLFQGISASHYPRQWLYSQ